MLYFSRPWAFVKTSFHKIIFLITIHWDKSYLYIVFKIIILRSDLFFHAQTSGTFIKFPKPSHVPQNNARKAQNRGEMKSTHVAHHRVVY